MSETKDKEKSKKTLSLSGNALNLGGGGPARQNVTHGRSGASVAVEVRRKRAPAQEESRTGDLSSLTDKEKESRAKALRESIAEGGAKKSALPKRRTTIESKEAENKKKEIEAKKKEDDSTPLTEEEERLKAADASKALAEDGTGPARREKTFGADATPESVRDRLKKADAKAPAKPKVQDRRGKRITVTQALNKDYERDRSRSMAAQKRAQEKARMAAQGNLEPPKKVLREVVIPETITVQELANRMTEPVREVIKSLMKMDVMATVTDVIDADTAELVIEEFGHKIKRVTEADVEIGMDGEKDKTKDLKPRPPVVTIMGHVDHGKTSLLDALRETDVAGREAGGITQHIGAYQVNMKSGEKITFLDTPGHAAFTEMRARGANVTDIVVVVVAANDSIMPQTIEAINHAKAAEVPIIIAVNKIDLPDANPAKVKQDLLQHEVIVEDMGGDVLCVEVSAMQKTNLDKLEEAIILQSEILELKVNPNRKAQGVVVEAKLEKGRGPVATVLIQRGTLRIADVFVAGAESGKVRALIDDHGNNIEEAIPGQPVEVLGFDAPPNAGDPFSVVGDEARAREISDYRQHKRKETQAAKAVMGRTTIEQLLEQKEEGEKTVLQVLIKADVHGSIEAIAGSFHKMTEENEGILVQILHQAVGGITESDVALAGASNALIIGFNVRANAQARDLAAREGVKISYYNVIYNVIDDAKALLSGMLAPSEREEYLGQAKILEVFNITKVGKVAGCVVEMGMVKRGAKVRLLRDDVVILDGGTLKTLKRHKDEVKEVKEGTECGMAFENYDDIKDGDVIECYDIIEEARTVE